MDMRTPILFPASDLWLYKAVGDTVPLEALDARDRIDLLLLERGTPLAARVLADPGSSFALASADQRFLLFVHERQMAGRDALRLRSYPAMVRAAAGEPFAPGDDPALVEREARRLLEDWPHNHLAHVSLARALLVQGRASEALDRLSRLVGEYPAAAVYRLQQALALESLGRLPEAVAALREARRRAPEFLDPYPRLAELLAGTGQPAEAREVLEDYARQRRYRLSAAEHVLLGRVRQATADLDGAADAYGRALWQLPDPGPLREAAEQGLAAVRGEPGGK
jgi:tetratricopeptide (TPR) repeat protein